MRPEQRRTAGCTRLRLKLLAYLMRSRQASCQLPSCVQVTFEGLFGDSANAKLKIMALQFLHQMIHKSVLLPRFVCLCRLLVRLLD